MKRLFSDYPYRDLTDDELSAALRLPRGNRLAGFMRGHILLLWFILIGFTTLLIDCQFIGTCSAFWKPDADASPLTAIAALSLVVMIPAAKRLALLEEFLARHPLEGSSTR